MFIKTSLNVNKSSVFLHITCNICHRRETKPSQFSSIIHFYTYGTFVYSGAVTHLPSILCPWLSEDTHRRYKIIVIIYRCHAKNLHLQKSHLANLQSLKNSFLNTCTVWVSLKKHYFVESSVICYFLWKGICKQQENLCPQLLPLKFMGQRCLLIAAHWHLDEGKKVLYVHLQLPLLVHKQCK